MLWRTYVYPEWRKKWSKNASEFESKYGMMQTFGCIDGTHVPILHPIENSQDYYCYKMFLSLTVQAVCAYRGVFMDVEHRWPCSVHVAKVFCNLIINKNLQNGKLPKTHQQILAGRQKVGNYLVGDPAFTWTPLFVTKQNIITYNVYVYIYVMYSLPQSTWRSSLT